MGHVRACIKENQKLAVMHAFVSALRRLMQGEPEFENKLHSKCLWGGAEESAGRSHPVKVFLTEELSPALSVLYLFEMGQKQ